MPALNFQGRFAGDVATGVKTQSIRRVHSVRPIIVGDALKLYTGMRTKGCRLLGMGEVFEVSAVKLSVSLFYDPPLVCSINGGDALADAVLEKFAREDGFPSADEMFEFFEHTHGLPFEGVLIQWRLKRI